MFGRQLGKFWQYQDVKYDFEQKSRKPETGVICDKFS